MGHLADLIEAFILKKMLGEQEDSTMLKRNELAEELQCAPSQISYVLSTRFTVEKGFIVESRRGSGGFVRIIKLPLRARGYQEAAEHVSGDIELGMVEEVIIQLRSQRLLTSREAGLMLQFFNLTQERLGAEEQSRVLRELLLKLADFS